MEKDDVISVLLGIIGTILFVIVIIVSLSLLLILYFTDSRLGNMVLFFLIFTLKLPTKPDNSSISE